MTVQKIHRLNTPDQSDSKVERVALLACGVFEKEIEFYQSELSTVVELEYFEMGLHDQPDVLRSTLQAKINTYDQRKDIDTIALAYGLCGCGTAGLHSKQHRLVIPRGHDCITVFLGSKERYAKHQSKCGGCMYYTPGWNRGRRVPGPDKLDALKKEFLEKFDPEDVDFLINSERSAWAMHDTATYIDLGTDDAESEAQYAKRCAEWLGWKFQRLKGKPDILKDLLNGNWDKKRFQIIEPGHQIAHSPNSDIMKSTPLD